MLTIKPFLFQCTSVLSPNLALWYHWRLQFMLTIRPSLFQCTSVLSFRPKASDKLLSCTLQSLEIFSCCLQSEEETALSIVDPMSITIELNANPLPVARPKVSGGLLDATVVEQKLLLEVKTVHPFQHCVCQRRIGYNVSCRFNPFPHSIILQQTTLNIFCQKLKKISIIAWITYD